MDKDQIRRMVRTAVENLDVYLSDGSNYSRVIKDDDILQDFVLYDSLDDVDLTIRLENALGIRLHNSLSELIGEHYSINDITDYLFENFDTLKKQ